MLTAGTPAPAFSGVDTDGQPIGSAEFAGRPYVLYFYPKDDTPGCTTEACEFRDAHPRFTELGVEVVGVSRDKTTAHRKFVDKYSLPFRLIADTDESVCKAFDVIQLKTACGRTSLGVVRTTYLVGADGVIAQAWPKVSVKGHVAAVQAAVEAMSKGA